METQTPPSGSPPPHSIEVLSRVVIQFGWDSVRCVCIRNWLFFIPTMVSTVSIIMGETHWSSDIHCPPTNFLVWFSHKGKAWVCWKRFLWVFLAPLTLKLVGHPTSFSLAISRNHQCIFVQTSNVGGLQDSYPVVFFEVGRSESRRKLEQDAGRLIGGTDGLVLLVVIIKIDCQARQIMSTRGNPIIS